MSKMNLKSPSSRKGKRRKGQPRNGKYPQASNTVSSKKANGRRGGTRLNDVLYEKLEFKRNAKSRARFLNKERDDKTYGRCGTLDSDQEAYGNDDDGLLGHGMHGSGYAAQQDKYAEQQLEQEMYSQGLYEQARIKKEMCERALFNDDEIRSVGL